MPRILDELMDCVVYLFPSLAIAQQGAPRGGTGFIVAVPNGRRVLVTNKHVLGTGNLVVRVNQRGGGVRSVMTSLSDWQTHLDNDDIAACPLVIEPSNEVKALPVDPWFCTLDEAAHYGVGDDIFMLGRFAPTEPLSRNRPISLFGSISQMPDGTVEDGRRMEVPAFLVDTRSISGFSGSPVFIHVGPSSFRGPDQDIMAGQTTMSLIGIDTGHYKRKYTAYISGGNNERNSMSRDSVTVEGESGVAIVAPAWRILELLVDM